jgi:alkylation response protein AidB-like acyl-CoA dehydrogenase
MLIAQGPAAMSQHTQTMMAPDRGVQATATVSEIAAGLAPMAASIDSDGVYPIDVLRALGKAGAYAGHLRSALPDLGAPIKAMAEVGAVCMSTAFCMWCQDACGWYLENTENLGLRDRLQPAIAGGMVLGGTGLSNPVKALSGIERFKLKATRVEGGYSVSGMLPWVSNLGEGHWFGTVFEDAADPAHRMMAMVQCGQPGVAIRQNAHFIALEGTGTYAVRFDKAFIAHDAMLADPLGDMVARIKPGFILLQTGMALGVIQGSINLMHTANKSLRHTNRYLPRQVETVEEDLAALTRLIDRLAATPRDGSREYTQTVLQARLRCSELALDAAQTALLHNGARGYIDGSPVSRRLRESYFVAIITPSIKHLRQELVRLDEH